MKKIITLALAAAFTMASHIPASAIEVKMDGEYLFQFQTSSEEFEGANQDFAGQRLRVGTTFTANENLSGYFQMQAGDTNWGDPESGGAFNSENGNAFFARQAYIDWTVPGTDVKVRMGRHAFDMPAYATSSPIITDMVSTGVVIDVPFNDTFGVTGFWSRAARVGSFDLGSKKYDIFGLVGNASFDGFTFSPWVIYANHDDNIIDGETESGFLEHEQGTIAAGQKADLVVFGGGFEWKPFAPVTFAMDAAYGTTKYSNSTEKDDEGWYVAASAAYALDFGEPTLKAWYASGDDEGARAQSGHVPSIYGDFDGSNTFFNSAPGIIGGHRTSIGGTWAVSAQLNGLSFLENLTHDLSVTYIAGTNDKNNVGDDYGFGYSYMTTEDSAVEFAAVNTFEIYKNLSAIFEAAYIIEDFDASRRADKDFENDWRMSLMFAYSF